MTQDDLLNAKNRVRTDLKMQFYAAKNFFEIKKQNWLKTREMTQDDLLNPKNRVRTDLKMQFYTAKKFFEIEKQNWLKTREMTQDNLLNPKKQGQNRYENAILCCQKIF